jgi:hypothetical protein
MLDLVSHIFPIVHPQYYTAATCCTVHSKLALAFLTIPVQLHRCIKIHTLKAFIFFSYSNTTGFGPTGHHQLANWAGTCGVQIIHS